MSTICYDTFTNALFIDKPYQITANSINIQNIATMRSFIGNYTQNQFTIPTNGGLSSPITLDVIDPVTNTVVDTITNQITLSLGDISQCFTTNTKGITTINNNAQLSGYSQYFGQINTIVIVNKSNNTFTKFISNINISFQTTLNGEAYSITANGLNIQIA